MGNSGIKYRLKIIIFVYNTHIMPKRDHPIGNVCLGDYINKKHFIRRKSTSWRKTPECEKCINHTFKLYEENKSYLSRISDEERAFFHHWVRKRNLEDEYLILSLTYWMRVKAGLATLFLVRDKRIYMILCIHIALKWLGYDEVYKCNFIEDIREVYRINPQEHSELEMDVLRELSWEL